MRAGLPVLPQTPSKKNERSCALKNFGLREGSLTCFLVDIDSPKFCPRPLPFPSSPAYHIPVLHCTPWRSAAFASTRLLFFLLGRDNAILAGEA